MNKDHNQSNINSMKEENRLENKFFIIGLIIFVIIVITINIVVNFF